MKFCSALFSNGNLWYSRPTFRLARQDGNLCPKHSGAAVKSWCNELGMAAQDS